MCGAARCLREYVPACLLVIRSNKPRTKSVLNVRLRVTVQVCGRQRAEDRLDASENWV